MLLNSCSVSRVIDPVRRMRGVLLVASRIVDGVPELPGPPSRYTATESPSMSWAS